VRNPWPRKSKNPAVEFLHKDCKDDTFLVRVGEIRVGSGASSVILKLDAVSSLYVL
jgi:hypothetical protein